MDPYYGLAVVYLPRTWRFGAMYDHVKRWNLGAVTVGQQGSCHL